MIGLFLKDLKMCKQEYLLLLALQLMVAIALIVMCVDSGTSLNEDVENMLSVMKLGAFVCDFFFISMNNTSIMTKDEQKNWNIFINSVPNGKKLQVRSKYISVLFMYICTASCLIIVDAVTVAICNNPIVSASGYILLLVCAFVIYEAIQMPFIIGFGGAQGPKIKGICILIILGIFGLYGLFGDLSFLMGDDVDKRILKALEFIQSGYFIAIFPYVATFLFWLSYRISLLVYNKEGGRYDE